MRVGAGVALIAAALVAACGSQVPPDAYYRAQTALGVSANGTTAGAATGGALPGAAATGASGSPTGAPSGSSSAASGGATAGAPVASTSAAAPRGSATAAGTTSAAAPHATSTRSAVQTTAAGSSPAAACTPPTSSAKPTVVVCPGTGLNDGQTVHIYASGFQNAKPSLVTAALVVTECADKGNNTQQGDCGSLHFVNPDKDGRLSMTITVVKVVGSNKDVCGATYQCLISVAQPKQPPDYEADQHISFRS